MQIPFSVVKFEMLRSDLIKLSLFIQVASVLAMDCSFCVSTLSWEDCITKEIKRPCMNSVPQSVCLTFHRKITLTNGNQVQHFVKACSPASLCTRDSCYDTEEGKITWCDFSCCSATLCNQKIKLMAPRNSSLSKGKQKRNHTQGNDTWSGMGKHYNQSTRVYFVTGKERNHTQGNDTWSGMEKHYTRSTRVYFVTGSATGGKLVTVNGSSRRNDQLPSFVPRAVFKNNSKNTHKGNNIYVPVVMAASFGIVARQLLH